MQRLGASSLVIAALTMATPAMAQQSAGMFKMAANSMMPTLIAGDVVFADRYTESVVPARGDLIVFRLPKDPSTIYIKRLIGLPGDRIQMQHGILYLNGRVVKQERVADYVDKTQGDAAVKCLRETLPNGIQYEVLDLVDAGIFDNTSIYDVPPGYYFVLGDNRDNSADRRALLQVGYIPSQNIVGRGRRP